MKYDEIQNFIDSRYVGPPEACWRIFEFPLHGKSHVVEGLPVHRLDEHCVLFQGVSDVANAVAEAKEKKTPLLGWFEHNEKSGDAESRGLLYQDFPTQYRWDKREAVWVKRMRKMVGERVLGRVHGVSPKEKERFYLRILLLHVRGARGYDDLKRDPTDPAGERILGSYQEACESRGLIDTDAEYEKVLEEEMSVRFPKMMRQLFALIVCECNLNDPLALYTQFRDALMADFFDRVAWTRGDAQESEHAALRDIQDHLERLGQSMLKYSHV